MIAITKIKILHTNDTHSYLDNFHKRKHFINSKREDVQNVLVVDSGDNLRGSLYYTIFHGEKEPYLLNQMHYDYLTLGNHDFDNGSKDVAHFLKAIDSQVILSNVDFSGDKYLKNMKNTHEYTVHRFDDGLSVGIFGLLTPTTLTSSSPSKQTHFFDPIDIAKKMVEKLQQEKVDVIVLLSHLGDDEDVKLANEVSGIHYIVGAHTHKVIEQPIVVTNDDAWETYIVQAGSYGNYIGEIDMEIANRLVTHLNYALTDLRKYPFYDNDLYEEIQQWDASMQSVVEEPIAIVKEDLVGKRDITKTQSTNLTNLITDAYFYKAVELGFKPDLAIMNSGGIRQSIDKGTVTYGDILQIVPFACEMFVCEISGKDLFNALDTGEYPQVSHAKLVYQQNEDILRLQSIELKKDGGYEPLDMDKIYVVATNSFIGGAKDEYFGFENKINLVQEEIFDTQVLSDYLKSLPQPIVYTNEIRKIVVIE